MMQNNYLHALLIDDDPDFAADFNMLLPDNIRCTSVNNVTQARAFLQDKEYDVIFLDIDLGEGGNGLEFLTELKSEFPYMPVIMITADQKIDSVVKAVQLGASDYVGKSLDLNALKISVDRAISENRLQQNYDFLESELHYKFGDLIGESAAMRQIKKDIERLAKVSSSVLITGTSGTGKELVAHCIHRLSDRCNYPFVAVNCAALSHELIESELFGHEKGAFTGAHTQRIGKFEITSEGTLFLDEITEIPLDVQAKFLRVLQENEFERVGGNKLIRFKGRILASSNRDVDRAVIDGRLREDLLFRLDVARLKLPPLRERKGDIPLLINYFLRKKSAEIKKNITGVSEKALQMLCLYDWPGNVRELANCLENAIVHAAGTALDVSDFKRLSERDIMISENYEDAKRQFLTKFQREYISALLKDNNGNVTATAQKMGVSRQGLIKMIKSCGLAEND